MKTIIILFFLALISNVVPAQTPDNSIASRLEMFKNEQRILKIDLQTDKDIYAPGEKIWYKISLNTVVEDMLPVNQILIVTLKTDQGEVIIDQKLVNKSGKFVQGSLTIPSWAPKGNAYLLAYTPEALSSISPSLSALKPVVLNRLERNDFVIDAHLDKKLYKPGEKVQLSVLLKALSSSARKERISIALYDGNQEILADKQRVETGKTHNFSYELPDEIMRGLYFVIETIGRGTYTSHIRVPATSDQIRIHFYPEGGNILLNHQQRIVYRAFDPYGIPVELEGDIFDQSGHQTGVAKILKNNLGLISLVPAAQSTYHLKINSGYGKNQQIPLPQPQTGSSAIHLVKSTEELILIDVFSNGDNIEKDMVLLAVHRGKIVLNNSFVAEAQNNFQISTNSLPQGIINFMVYLPQSGIISERLMYNGPSLSDSIINLQLSDSIFSLNSHFDLSVTIDTSFYRDKNFWVDLKVVDRQNCIGKTWDNNTPTLKYPLIDYPPNNVLTRYITNIELIANEYQCFSYKNVFNNNLLTDKTFDGISGTVNDKNGQPVVNANVLLQHPQYSSPYAVKTDSMGRFVFKGVSRSNEMTVKAVSDNGKKTFDVQLDAGFNEAIEDWYLKELFMRKPAYNIDTYNYYSQNRVLLANIGTETKDKRPQQPSQAEKMLKSGLSILEVIKMIKPFDIVNNQIVFYGSQNSINFQQGALIVIDGQKTGTGIDILNQLSPSSVTSINISTNPIDIQRYTGLNSVGIIEINTFGMRGFEKEENASENAQVFSYELFNNNTWPYQTTLLWLPNADINNDGTFKTRVNTSGIVSDFLIEVTLTDEMGVTLRKQQMVKVQPKK